MIYRKVIRDTVRVRLKYGERSGGDCRISKQDFEKINAPFIRWNYRNVGSGHTHKNYRSPWTVGVVTLIRIIEMLGVGVIPISYGPAIPLGKMLA